MRLILILFIISFNCFAQQDSIYKHRTISGDFKVIEINCKEPEYFTIYVKSLSNEFIYKIVSIKSSHTPKNDRSTVIKLKKDTVFNLNLKSYFNISKRVGNDYYPISSSNNIHCTGIGNNIKVCIENEINMDKDVFFVSELTGLYLLLPDKADSQ